MNLMQHQIDAISFIKKLYSAKKRGCCINIQQGGGKTLIMLKFIEELPEDIRVHIVSYNDHIIQHMKQEIVKFSLHIKCTVVFATYSTIDTINEYDVLVVDESHLTSLYMKSIDAVSRIFTITLTGTPNYMVDFHIIRVKYRLYKISRYCFIKKLIDIPEMMELTPLKIKRVFIDMDQHVQKSHDSYMSSLLNCSPKQRVHVIYNLRKQFSFYKVSKVVEMCLSSKHERIVIVSEFTQTLMHLLLELQHLKPSTLFAQFKQLGAIESFYSGDSRILLAESRRISHGINLTNADVIILVDPSYTKIIDDQLAARFFRLNHDGLISKQEKTLIKLLYKGSIEERIEETNTVSSDEEFIQLINKLTIS